MPKNLEEQCKDLENVDELREIMKGEPVSEALYKTPDPWKNRSAGMCCRTCMYFVPKKPTDPEQHEPLFKSNGVLGRCRRHAPTMSGFPAVFESDNCGDHKLDENKI